MSLDIKSYPRFNGRHYKKWVDQMVPLLRIVDLMDILNGTLTAPTVTIAELAMPAHTPATGTTATVLPSAMELSFYNAQLGQYERYVKVLEKYQKR